MFLRERLVKIRRRATSLKPPEGRAVASLAFRGGVCSCAEPNVCGLLVGFTLGHPLTLPACRDCGRWHLPASEREAA